MSDLRRHGKRADFPARVFGWVKWFARAATGGSGGVDEATDERRLVARVVRGGSDGKKAYQTLVERHQNWLVYFLLSLLSNQTDAEDVAQDVFVRAYLSIDRFRGDARFKTWIRRIAINQAYNFRRDGRRHKVQKTEGADIASDDASFSAVNERDALTKVLNELDYDERQILILRYAELMTVQEVAATLDLGLSATKMRIKRARENFRYHYESVTDESKTTQST